MQAPADLAVPVEVRALDVGARVERVWRLSRAVGLAGLRLERALPFEAGRPVRATFALPGDPSPLSLEGTIEAERPPRPAPDPERDDEAGASEEEAQDDAPRPLLIRFAPLATDDRLRLQSYVDERTLCR